jgi:hypothetical protein
MYSVKQTHHAQAAMEDGMAKGASGK